jgi:predicted nucleic acid-binding protein
MEARSLTVCVDTDVLIDCLRGQPAARQWLQADDREPVVVPGVVAMELVAGCRDSAQLRGVQSFLAALAIAWPDAEEGQSAYELLVRHRLADGMSVPDCFVAAAAMHRGVRLYTFNVRRYRAVDGLDVRQPYDRQAVP